tara:strand:- start:239 stop:361 length:123 start_codon:yes stop_codon:yes gene_type:complete
VLLAALKIIVNGINIAKRKNAKEPNPMELLYFSNQEKIKQ